MKWFSYLFYCPKTVTSFASLLKYSVSCWSLENLIPNNFRLSTRAWNDTTQEYFGEINIFTPGNWDQEPKIYVWRKISVMSDVKSLMPTMERKEWNVYGKKSFLSKEWDIKILPSTYFAYEVGIISSAKCMKYINTLCLTLILQWVICRHGIHTAQEPGSLFWCHAVMSLQFTHIRSFACRNRLRNLRANFFTGSFYCVTITWQQIYYSLQVTILNGFFRKWL